MTKHFVRQRHNYSDTALPTVKIGVLIPVTISRSRPATFRTIAAGDVVGDDGRRSLSMVGVNDTFLKKIFVLSREYVETPLSPPAAHRSAPIFSRLPRGSKALGNTTKPARTRKRVVVVVVVIVVDGEGDFVAAHPYCCRTVAHSSSFLKGPRRKSPGTAKRSRKLEAGWRALALISRCSSCAGIFLIFAVLVDQRHVMR